MLKEKRKLKKEEVNLHLISDSQYYVHDKMSSRKTALILRDGILKNNKLITEKNRYN